MKSLTDTQLLDMLENIYKSGDEDFTLEISTEEDDGDTSALNAFTSETQWICDNSVRKILCRIAEKYLS